MAIVTLTWDPTTHRSDGSSAVAVSYRMQRRAGGGSYSADLISGVTATTHRDTVPDPSMGSTIRYCYRLRAEEGGYNPSPWVEACVDVGEATVGPGKPTLTATPGSNFISVAGSPGSGGPVSEWRFRYKLDAAADWNDWSPWGSGATYRFDGLMPATDYEVQAEARNTAGAELTDPVDVSTLAPDAVSGPTLALSATSTTVQATVGRPATGGEPDRYVLTISENSDLSKPVGTQTLLSPGAHTFTNLKPSTTYYVRAIAYIESRASTPTDDNVTTSATDAVSFQIQSPVQVETGSTVTVDITGITPTTATFDAPAAVGSNGDVTAGSVTGSGAERTITFTGVRDGSESFDITGKAPDLTDTTHRVTVNSVTATCVPGIPSITTRGTNFSVSAEVSPAPDGCVPSEYQFQMAKGAPLSGSTPSDDPTTPDPEFIDTGWGAATSRTFSNLLTDTLYSVRSRARSGADESLWGDWTAWQPQRTRDACQGASLSIVATPDRLLLAGDATRKDVALAVTRSANVVANPPTVTVPATPADFRDFLSATIVQNQDGTHKLTLMAFNARPEERVTGTLQVRVAGTCSTSATDDVTVTVEPPGDQCAGIGPPTGAASTYRGGMLAMSLGAQDFIAQAQMGEEANGMDITVTSDPPNIVMIQALTAVRVLRDLSGFGRDLRQRSFRITPAAPGTTFVTITFKSKLDDTVCDLRVATTAFEVTVTSG